MSVPIKSCGFFPYCWCGKNLGLVTECRRPPDTPPKAPEAKLAEFIASEGNA